MADAERIDELLGQASDPVQRAIVIVLGNINRELQANTAATQALTLGVAQSNKTSNDLSTLVTTHMHDEEIMLAGFRGSAKLAMWVGPALFTVLGSAGAYLWLTQAAVIAELTAEFRVVKQHQVVNEEIINDLRRRQALDESQRQSAPR